jgi:hypothetical protein
MSQRNSLEVADHASACIERLSKNDLILRNQIY